MPARFRGLAPWESDSQIIECMSLDYGLIDLHNSAVLHEVRFVLAGQPCLSLVFEVEPTLWITLTFNDVRDVVFRQTAGGHWPQDVADVETFDAIDYHDSGSDHPHFTVATLFGDVEFDAAEVVIAPIPEPQLPTAG